MSDDKVFDGLFANFFSMMDGVHEAKQRFYNASTLDEMFGEDKVTKMYNDGGIAFGSKELESAIKAKYGNNIQAFINDFSEQRRKLSSNEDFVNFMQLTETVTEATDRLSLANALKELFKDDSLVDVSDVNSIRFDSAKIKKAIKEKYDDKLVATSVNIDGGFPKEYISGTEQFKTDLRGKMKGSYPKTLDDAYLDIFTSFYRVGDDSARFLYEEKDKDGKFPTYEGKYKVYTDIPRVIVEKADQLIASQAGKDKYKYKDYYITPVHAQNKFLSEGYIAEVSINEHFLNNLDRLEKSRKFNPEQSNHHQQHIGWSITLKNLPALNPEKTKFLTNDSAPYGEQTFAIVDERKGEISVDNNETIYVDPQRLKRLTETMKIAMGDRVVSASEAYNVKQSLGDLIAARTPEPIKDPTVINIGINTGR